MIGSRTGAGCPDRGKLVKGEPTVPNGPVPPSSRAFSSARYQCSDIAVQWAQSKAVACHRNRDSALHPVAGMWAAQIKAGDTVSGPYATASIAPIAEHDIAAVAAKAFLTDDLVGRRVAQQPPGDAARMSAKIDTHIHEDALACARKLGISDSQLLESALTEWMASNT